LAEIVLLLRFMMIFETCKPVYLCPVYLLIMWAFDSQAIF